MRSEVLLRKYIQSAFCFTSVENNWLTREVSSCKVTTASFHFLFHFVWSSVFVESSTLYRVLWREEKKTVFILSRPETSVSVAHVSETSVLDSIRKWKLGFLCSKMAQKYIDLHVSSSVESFVSKISVLRLVWRDKWKRAIRTRSRTRTPILSPIYVWTPWSEATSSVFYSCINFQCNKINVWISILLLCFFCQGFYTI